MSLLHRIVITATIILGFPAWQPVGGQEYPAVQASAVAGAGLKGSPGQSERVVTNSISMKLARIPAGRFLMGSPDSERDARADEKPQHPVSITRPFFMGVHEVTQSEFRRVMGRNESFFSPDGPGKDDVAGLDTDRFPVEQITWHDAVQFCKRLSERPAEKRAGRVYRLPTEAEWEYTCRARRGTTFHFGDSLSSQQANFNGEFPYGDAKPGRYLGRPTTVGSYPPNEFGLYDMHGNVWEWCWDRYGPEYYKTSPVDDPTGPKTGHSRVIRGGGWRSDGRDCRSAFRYADVLHGQYYVTGFRVVMIPAEQTASDSVVKAMAGALPEAGQGSADNRVRDGRYRPANGNVVPDFIVGEEWPRWRGPRGNGTWHGPKLPDEWPETGLRRLWRREIGGGYAGVVVTRGRAYVTDHLEEPNDVEPGPRSQALPGNPRAKPNDIERVLCFDARSGKSVWSYEYPVEYVQLQYDNGPRSTPTVHDGRIYTLGAVGHLHCLDAATGQLVWKRELIAEFNAERPGWGFSCSPVVFEDLLIVQAGGKPNAGVIALDRRTGEEVWRNLPDGAGYATPILTEAAGITQLVCWTPTHVRGLNPRSGELLWSIPFRVTYGTSIATPICRENIVLVSGYWEGSKAIRLGPSPQDAEVLWEDRRNLRGLMSQPLYRDGYGYLLDKRHGLSCFEYTTGEKLWDDGNRMTPKGRNPQASVVWLEDGNRVIVLNSDGELVLARFNPEGYQEQSRAPIIGPTWAHPAFAGDCIYARNDEEIVCVSLLTADRPDEPQ